MSAIQTAKLPTKLDALRCYIFAVILAPYGLAAHLTGQGYRESDPRTQQILDEWRQFYVLPSWEGRDGAGDSTHLPAALEVVVGKY